MQYGTDHINLMNFNDFTVVSSGASAVQSFHLFCDLS